MGSIQALRSEALAARSRDDTELQVATYLGGVNKSLGGQTLNMLDSLQQAVVAKTQAYNKAQVGLKMKIEKKGGLQDTMIQFGFKLIDSFIKQIASVKNIVVLAVKLVKAYSANVAGLANFAKENAASLAALAFDLVSMATLYASNSAMFDSIKHNVKSATYDYEKMVSQLGMMDKRPTGIVSTAAAGASRILDSRDALMPRYKPKQGGAIFSAAYNTTGGYVGSLRKV